MNIQRCIKVFKNNTIHWLYCLISITEMQQVAMWERENLMKEWEIKVARKRKNTNACICTDKLKIKYIIFIHLSKLYTLRRRGHSETVWVLSALTNGNTTHRSPVDIVKSLTQCDGIVRVAAYAFRHDGVLCHLHTHNRAFPLLNTLYIVEETVTHDRAHTKRYKVSVRWSGHHIG